MPVPMKACCPLLLLLICSGLESLAAEKPVVETEAASSLGTTGITFNGRVNPRGAPATWHFEYGPSERYGKATTPQPLPPRLAAFYRESWDERLGGWQAGMDGKGLAHHAEGGAAGGFVRFAEPSEHDFNHVDGIGTLHLASYFYPGSHPNAQGWRAALGGGDPDLRDARVRLQVRGNAWAPNGSECVWWTQSDHELAPPQPADWRRANWAYTGFSLNRFLRSGKWEAVEYRLRNRSHDWTYGGNNLAQRRPNYAYASIDRAQAAVSCDFFHLLAGVDPARPPTGSIDFDEFELAYRNYSLLLPSNGGRLLRAPGGDPTTLTDGWRHGAERMWRSEENPAEPLEFAYAFERPVVIERVQIHQHPEWPAKAVEVLASADGAKWQPVLAGDLPASSPGGPNFAHLLRQGLAVAAREVRVRVLSGWQPRHWGLGEIEVFGTGARMQTDDDWYHVNADLLGPAPGETCHYRLVITTDAGTVAGENRSFRLPRDAAPEAITGAATPLGEGAATL